MVELPWKKWAELLLQDEEWKIDRLDDTVSDAVDDDLDIPTEEMLNELQTAMQEEDMTMQDFEEAESVLRDMFSESTPEISNLIESLSPELDELKLQIWESAENKRYQESLQLIRDFIEKRLKPEMKKLKMDSAEKQAAELYVQHVLDLFQLKEQIQQNAPDELKEIGIQLVPWVGQLYELWEAAAGREFVTWKSLTWGERVWKWSMATVLFALNFAYGSGSILKALTKSKKVAWTVKKASKGTKWAAAAAEMGKDLSKLAVLGRKSGKSKEAMQSLRKLGKLIENHPRIASYVFNRIEASHEIARNERKEEITRIQRGGPLV